jgi:hypothetical protein
VLYGTDRCRPSNFCEDRPRRRVGTSSYGFDPTLCGLGSDPYGSLNQSRIRVPPNPSTGGAGEVPAQPAFMFQLCTVGLPNRCCRLMQVRQILELGEDTNAGTPPVYPLIKRVGRSGAGNPAFRFPDGYVSWHVRLVRQIPVIPWSSQSVLSTDSFMWRWSASPALVFETATFPAADLDWRGHPDNYLTLNGYTPPWGGQPLGENVGDLGTFYEVRFPDDDPSKQAIDPIPVQGPGALVFYACVWQTNASARTKITVPASFSLDPELPEDGFVCDFTSANYWGIGGSLTVEV